MNDRASPAVRSRPPRRQTRFLKRHIATSDHHSFITRLSELGIVAYHFDSYEELCRHPDCKYAYDTGRWMKTLTRRVESLNIVGDMLWLDPVPPNFRKMPLTRYQWLQITKDVFLVRYVSVVDCALLLINEVFEMGLPQRACTIERVAKADIPTELRRQLKAIADSQELVRSERNSRVHRGVELELTDDDATFETASLFIDRYNGTRGRDRHGRKLDLDIAFRAGLVTMQREFNTQVRSLERQLDGVYDLLWEAFEARFGPLIAAATHGLNVGSRHRP
ncbi:MULTISPECIES: Cthe_2314 family HEPN domain-containing protein [unclassified Rhizobium]|jgi:hypothetical protein|uniref:Cthe_2314 family HEPN domain-containing protein n=1 Tax=Hyphomicrobiales TaxID=356 RepID=UPI000647F455|nr:Cthe_2314 family HEPN domain-containing protein [Rhizobium sp. WW_1]RKD74054.1 hypothetical protein BJ928_101403 [Rhizobium sp. WW_1]